MRSDSRFILFFLAAAFLPTGCSDDTTPTVVKDQAVSWEPVTKPDASRDVARKDAPLKPPDQEADPDYIAWVDKQLADFNMPVCSDVPGLLNDALTNGLKVFKGLTVTTSSTPIADVLKNMAQYTGKVVRIEGFIIDVCPWAGCYITLKDKSGGKMNLKVADGTYDFRLTARYGYYAVGEGYPAATGDHGPQVDIQQHGARLGQKLCPVP